MAKLNFRNEVKQYDVDEALKLMDFSIRSLRSMKEDKSGSKKRAEREMKKDDRTTQVMQAVRELMNTANE